MSNATPGGFTTKAQAIWYGGQFTEEQSEASHRQRRQRRQKAEEAAEAGPPPLPEVGNPAWGVPIYGKDLAVGDVLVHLHRDHETHLIDRFTPYTGGLPLDKGARTAWAGTWDLAVGPYAIIRILPRGGAQ